ncbi:MAG: ATP synthase F1 subunit gamma [Chloroflexi bacterium UTCFX4]|jgi:F-type H+-transporting ATPase subunit gamma|nr:MAG: ATP synthase F1 subunit gamma [Chloroflexi bacterium UTCFX4]
MATLRQIRQRIRSVKNISQVTRAMEMIAAAEMRRAQQATLASRNFSEKAREVMQYVATEPGRSKLLHPLLEERSEVKAIAVVLFTADRGLAGAYNVNIIRKALDFCAPLEKQGKTLRFITVGKRGRDLMRRFGKHVVADFSEMGTRPEIVQVSALARAVLDEFLHGNADQVYLAYTNFGNVLRQTPTLRRVLPIEQAEIKREGPPQVYLYEPNAEQVLDQVLPRFVEVQVYQALLEAIASEQAARMMAMRNATDNAKELIESLTLLRNKVRQASITKEILDIVGGAEALRQAK